MFHPRKPWLYVISELLPYVTAFRYDKKSGELEEIGGLPTVEGMVEEDLSDFFSLTHPSDGCMDLEGKKLYVANRGEDSVAVFTIDSETGALKFCERVKTGGEQPWSCALAADGRFLYVVNQKSNQLVVLEQKEGRWQRTGQDFCVERPVCVRVLSV